MKTTIEQLELDLIAGDEVIADLESGHGKMSQSTRKYTVQQLKALQLSHKLFVKVTNRYSRKQIVLIGIIAVILGIGSCKAGAFLEGTAPLDSYTSDSTSYSYRRGQEINSQIAGWMTAGFFLIISPALAGVFFVVFKSRSENYLSKIQELKKTNSKTI